MVVVVTVFKPYTSGYGNVWWFKSPERQLMHCYNYNLV